MNKLLPILIVLLLGCNAQKRLNRLIERNPELITKDTIIDTVTVIVPEVRVDTILRLENMLDTVYITEDRLHIKTIYKDNKIYISGKCDTDTIEIIREIPVDRIIIKELTFWQKNRSWILPLLILAIGGALAKKFF